MASVEDILVEEEFEGGPLLENAELRRGIAAARDKGRAEGGPGFAVDDDDESCAACGRDEDGCCCPGGGGFVRRGMAAIIPMGLLGCSEEGRCWLFLLFQGSLLLAEPPLC